MQLLSRSHFKLEAFAVVETEKEMLSHFLTKLLESLCLCLGVGTICFALGEAFKIQTNVSIIFQEWTPSSQAWGPYEILKSRRTQTSTKRHKKEKRDLRKSLVNDA